MDPQLGAHREEGSPLQKAIIRYSDGRVTRAYLPIVGEPARSPAGPDVLALRDVSGAHLNLTALEIKAVFLVKSFEGNPNYVEFKNFPERPGDPGLWIRVLFKDRETLEGVAPNSLATFVDPIFSMTPPDPMSNNQAVMVSKASLADMLVLGFEATR